MSEPKRYLLKISLTPDGFDHKGFQTKFYQDPNGQFIDYDDYARLKAKVEKLKLTFEKERQVFRYDWNGLRLEKDRVQRALEKAEIQIERLTKAGDSMAEQLHNMSFDTAWDFWNAAKERNDAQ